MRVPRELQLLRSEAVWQQFVKTRLDNAVFVADGDAVVVIGGDHEDRHVQGAELADDLAAHPAGRDGFVDVPVWEIVSHGKKRIDRKGLAYVRDDCERDECGGTFALRDRGASEISSIVHARF